MKIKVIRLIISLIASMLFIVSCNNDGWEKDKSGLKIKFLSKNTEGRTAEIGDLLVLDVKYFTESNKLIDQNDYYRTQHRIPSHKGGSFEDALSIIHVGDSVVFILDAQNYYEKTRKRVMPEGFSPGDKMHVYIRFTNIISQDQFETEKLAIFHADEKEEMRLLESYLERANIKVDPIESGVYIVESTPGSGKKAEVGNILTIDYAGTLLDGKMFESTYQDGKTFSFRLGSQEVIQGFNEAFIGMSEGTKARLIIPSSMAFGKNGYKDLILPYSTLLYYVELISVK